MKEHENHHTSPHTIVESFKEEGAVTVESIDVVTHDNHHTKHTRKGFTLSTPVAIIIGAVIVAGGLMGYGLIMKGTTPTDPKKIFAGKAISDADLMTGNLKSKVIVMEYSDTECPFCAQLHPTITKIQKDYASKIGFVYRYFPLTQIHPHSFEESRTVYCVGKLGGASKREEYINQMFTEKLSKQNMVLPVGGKEALAKNIGINENDLKACLTSNESSDAINASVQDGVAAGVQGTPATFVLLKNKKGYEVISLVDGARPYEYFKTVIDEALAR